MFVYIPPFHVVSGQADIALKAAQFIGGANLVNVLRVIIVVALFTSVSSLFMAGPRVIVKMAEDKVLPSFLRAPNTAPLMAVTLQAVLVLLMVWIVHLRALLSYLSMTLSISSVLSVATLFKLYPLNCLTSLRKMLAPSIFIVLTLSYIILAGYSNPYEAIASAGTVLFSLLLYYCVFKKISKMVD